MKIEEVKNISVLGTGTMGYGITLVFAMAKYRVNMFGRSLASAELGLKNIQTTLETFLKKGLVQQPEIAEILARISITTNLEEAVNSVHFVIEAIDENLILKQRIFSEIENFCSCETILASNTSGLSPTDIANCLKHKNRFVVAHFWNPAYLMPVVEVVPGDNTVKKTVDTTCKLMEKIGKIPVTLEKEFLGFIGNRLQMAMLREALNIVESGVASVEAVDAIVKHNLGRRLSITGPFESVDLGGVDIFYNISEYLIEELCASKEIPLTLKNLFKNGSLGVKTGKGFYSWTEDSIVKIIEFRENSLIERLRQDKHKID